MSIKGHYPLKSKSVLTLLLYVNIVKMLSSWIVSVALLAATTFAQTNFTNLVSQLPNCTVSS